MWRRLGMKDACILKKTRLENPLSDSTYRHMALSLRKYPQSSDLLPSKQVRISFAAATKLAATDLPLLSLT